MPGGNIASSSPGSRSTTTTEHAPGRSPGDGAAGGACPPRVRTPALPARTADLFAPGLRGLTLGIVSTITLIALESLAIGTVMPIVADELGDLPLYGWVYSAFFLGNMIGIVLVGGALDRMPRPRPFAVGLALFAMGLLIGGLAPSMQVLIAARFLQGLGGGCLTPTAYVAIGRRLPRTSSRGCSP